MTRRRTTIQRVEVTQEAPQPAGPETRRRKPSQKQQQLVHEQAQRHEKAITKAVRAEQQLQELSGFRRQSTEDYDEPESEDEESGLPEEANNSTFNALEVTIPKRNPNLVRHAPPSTTPSPPEITSLRRNPNLVRRAGAIPLAKDIISNQSVCSTPSISAEDQVMRQHSSSQAAPGPYTPALQHFYGNGDGTFYSPDVHEDHSVYLSDDEFGTHLPPGMYQKPKQIFYPDAHPDLQQFRPKVAANAKSDSAASEVDAPSTALGVRKAPPATTSVETTRVIKSTKVLTGGTRGCTRASDFDELTKAVLEDAITVYKGKLFTHGAFLDRSEEYDLAVESFVFVCKTQKIQMEIEDDLMKLITQRSSQARGECKSKARPLVAPAFGINPERPLREVRNKVEDLLDRMNFLYKDPVARTGLFQNQIISVLINTIWFKNKNDEGANNPYFLQDGIPLPTIALVFTVIECCLDEWQTGQHVDVQFTAASYKEKYNGHLKTLQDFDQRTKEVGIIPKLRYSLAKKARKHAKIVDKPTGSRVTQIDDLDIEAAKKEWEGFNDSDDEAPVLAYGQSRYVRDFGLDIKTSSLPMEIPARIINPPELKYGLGSKQATVQPKEGSWNLVDKKFTKPMSLGSWIVVIFVPQNCFSADNAKDTIQGWLKGAKMLVSMQVPEKQPLFVYKNPQSIVDQSIFDAVMQNRKERNTLPTFILCILLDGSNEDLHTAVKNCGDIKRGVPNQCLGVGKCRGAKQQYWANVALKINAKLGGVNVIPDPKSAPIISDPAQPTIAMGKSSYGYPPRAANHPHTPRAMVANVDSHGARYIAKTAIQLGRQEMIGDLCTMAKAYPSVYASFSCNVENVKTLPKRLIFFRDGVSEGKFKHVLDQELPLLQGTSLIILIVSSLSDYPRRMQRRGDESASEDHVHRCRETPSHKVHSGFGKNDKDKDSRSGNLLPGTVVDQGITNPVEFDFYLWSHGGILGTSKCSHYNVVHDDFGFNVDVIEALANTLCYTYARSTRSVSIPTPVYYAHIVCSRAKTHYDTQGTESSVMSGGSQTREEILDSLRGQYRPVHEVQAKRMYFM
ncbi:uncharacterized protein ARMOST_02639 [Armillaria ostoyae]|uniref:Piwi domain-containing protein n=1 Tax=Armillaria ostoyae TaxID=47428 RepID=A0A284QS98_ARMOS|nr:uncharacterized protein ARMOST_02639 [Armillaria ostoyae]